MRFSRSTALSHVGFGVLVAALVAVAGGAARLPEAVEQAARTITADDARAHLRFLASDELQGRGTGHTGNQVAELYLASVFERVGLERATGVSYLQAVELYSSTLGAANALVISEQIHGAAVAARYVPGSDFYPHPASSSRSVAAGLVFAGYGITAPEYQYDDYAGLDAQGRVVIALDGEPQSDDPQSRFDGRASTPFAGADHKIENARRHGAVGLLLVRTRMRDLQAVWPEHPSVRNREFALALHVDRRMLPVAMVSLAAADAAIRSGQRRGEPGAADLRKKIDGALDAAGERVVNAPASFAIDGRQITLTTDLARERVVVHNVIGMITGADPRLKHEIVVIGAHLDHDGIDGDGRIFNGADDNASGTVGVLEGAEAFAAAARDGRRPARTVVFALWNGEEKGDLGSEYYVEHPVPAGTLVANVNMDMIGRNEEVPDPNDFRFRGLKKTSAAENTNTVHLLGYTYSPELAAIVRQENAAVGLTIKEVLDVHPQNLIRRSDQWSFLQQRVPAVFLTTGLHPDYHTPQDDIARINIEKLEKIARLAFRVAWRLASDSERPDFTDPRKTVRATPMN